jgi:hypothetical protein
MVSNAFHILFTPWKWILARFLPIWSALPTFLPRQQHLLATRSRSPADAKPLTEEQRQNMKLEYIQCIDTDAICALASRHNKNLPCRLDESTPTTHGSFNICFFVEFYTTVEQTKWVVRVPIEPVLHRVWEKVQSEVCTMQ